MEGGDTPDDSDVVTTVYNVSGQVFISSTAVKIWELAANLVIGGNYS